MATFSDDEQVRARDILNAGDRSQERPAALARPTRPTLSRDFILRTALDLVDREGIDRLTMRRLGTEMGVDPMAVYHWVPSKTALFDGLTELIWMSVDLDAGDTAGPWQKQIADAMQRFRTALRQHPHAIAMMGTRSLASPGALALVDRGLGILCDSGGFGTSEAMSFVNTLAAFTIGHVLAEVGEPVGGAPDVAAALETVNRQSLPHLAAVYSGGWTYRPQADYTRGLTALIAGWPAQSQGHA